MELDLPFIWAALIAFAVLAYVLLDGFDLGVGILHGFAPEADRDTVMNAIVPVWDGNETWLILGALALLAVFPLAFAIIIPALYFPVLLMLLALVFRGVAFEFRAHGRKSGKVFWTAAFAGGSIAAWLSPRCRKCFSAGRVARFDAAAICRSDELQVDGMRAPHYHE